MDFRTFTTRQALATLGACFALLLLASPANAVPDGFQPQLKSEQPYQATRTGIPDSVAAALEQAATAPTVIPVSSVDSPPAAERGFAWETTGYVAGGILAAMLLALMSTIALRHRGGLKSA